MPEGKAAGRRRGSGINKHTPVLQRKGEGSGLHTGMTGDSHPHFRRPCFCCPISCPLLPGWVSNIACPFLLSSWLPEHPMLLLPTFSWITKRPSFSYFSVTYCPVRQKAVPIQHLCLTLFSLQHCPMYRLHQVELAAYSSASCPSLCQKYGLTVTSLCLSEDRAQAVPGQDLWLLLSWYQCLGTELLNTFGGSP